MANIPRVTVQVDPDTTVRKTYRAGDTSKTVYVTVNKGTAVVVEPFPAPAPAPTPAPVLAIPSEVQGKSAAVSGTAATITWTASPAAQQVDYYAVYLKHNGTDLGDGGRPSITGTSVAIPNLAPGAYEFAVAAHNAVGMGPGWPPGLTWMPFTIAGATPAPAPAPAPGPAPSAPTLVRAESVAGDGFFGDRGNGWGGGQPRYTVHNDCERMLYVRGEFNGANRYWKLIRRSTNGSWSTEAEGQTCNEAFLLRDPTTDLAHIVSYPGGGSVPYISSGPGYQPVAIPGQWSSHDVVYSGAGIGADGTIVVRPYNDQLLPGTTFSKDCEWLWCAGKWNGSRVVFGAVQRKYIGLRRVYNYVLPGAFGNPAEFVDVCRWAGRKEHVAPAVVAGTYTWDGFYEGRALMNDADSLKLVEVMPRRTSTTETVAANMGVEDAFADSKGRLIALVSVSDPNGPSGIYLSVRNTSGNVHQGLLGGLSGGNLRLHEDTKARLWVLEFANPSRVYRLNDNFTLGAPTTINFPKSYDAWNGIGRVAPPRGGSARSDTISGSYCVTGGDGMVAYQIRLPA